MATRRMAKERLRSARPTLWFTATFLSIKDTFITTDLIFLGCNPGESSRDGCRSPTPKLEAEPASS